MTKLEVTWELEVMETTVEKQFDPVPCQRPSETTTGQNLLEKKSDLFLQYIDWYPRKQFWENNDGATPFPSTPHLHYTALDPFKGVCALAAFYLPWSLTVLTDSAGFRAFHHLPSYHHQNQNISSSGSIKDYRLTFRIYQPVILTWHSIEIGQFCNSCLTNPTPRIALLIGWSVRYPI